MQIGSVTSLYLLCCILHIVKIKDLANTIAAALFFPLGVFLCTSGPKLNGCPSGNGFIHESRQEGHDNLAQVDAGSKEVDYLNSSSSMQIDRVDVMENDCCHLALR